MDCDDTEGTKQEVLVFLFGFFFLLHFLLLNSQANSIILVMICRFVLVSILFLSVTEIYTQL